MVFGFITVLALNQGSGRAKGVTSAVLVKWKGFFINWVWLQVVKRNWIYYRAGSRSG
jgi:hypothetical protein